MENINLECALSEEIQTLLNHQIAMEHNASAQYLVMASWADAAGYKNSADFLYKQAAEEKTHMLKIIHYINDAGGYAKPPMSMCIKKEAFISLKEVFTTALQHEINTSKAIHVLVDYCLANKEFATFGFLQWFLTEQIEEEAVARGNLGLFDLIGEEGIGLYTIDKEIGNAIQSLS